VPSFHAFLCKIYKLAYDARWYMRNLIAFVIENTDFSFGVVDRILVGIRT
jgi:hypothetical protein